MKLWDIQSPNLYSVHVRLLQNGKAIDIDSRKIGFRKATFTDQGFSINGKIVKLRGLDRHQTFPFVGQAMPARVQRKGADILRRGLHCNLVRTSHYPQSRHFLDRCDEIGLLVLEEIPGWQHIGPEPWKQVSIDNVGRMIRRDWNHPPSSCGEFALMSRSMTIASTPGPMHSHMLSMTRGRRAEFATSRSRSFWKMCSP